MAYDPSIEDPEVAFLTTTRTLCSRLWFVANEQLEERILAYLAKYAAEYGVILYAFILMGNHYHLVARYPNANKADFLQSFNSVIARLTGTIVTSHEGGKLWGRRARSQILPRPEDIEHWFLYCALNPVSSGLCEKPSHYKGYNSCADALLGRTRTFEVVDWADYQNRKRGNKRLTRKDCTTTYVLEFARLPGYENMPVKEYVALINEKKEARRLEIVEERRKEGLGFPSPEALGKIKPGAKPHSTKTSDRWSYRPLCLTLCDETRRAVKERIFTIIEHFREASLKFRSGMLTAVFPPGTYRPRLKVGFNSG